MANDRFRRRRIEQSSLEITVTQNQKPETTRTVVVEWARIAGSAAQILMLLIVAGGYFYTVLPLFQHQLLEEEAAELELEVRNKEDQLLAVEPKIRAAEQAVQELKNRESELAEQIQASEIRLRQTARELEHLLWDQFVEELEDQSRYNGLTNLMFRNLNDWSTDTLQFEQTKSPDAYLQMLDAAETIKVADNGKPYPNHFADKATSLIEAERDNLTCEVLDVDSFDRKYQQELREKRRQFEEANGEGTISSRARFTLDVEFELHKKYSDSIYDVLGKCDDKRKSIIQKLRNVAL